MKLAWLAALALLASALMFPTGYAQEPTPGAVYVTNRVLSNVDTGTKVFATTMDAPTGAASQKAYLALSTLLTSQITAFQFPVTEPFTLAGPIAAKFFVSCDRAVVWRPASSGVAASTQFQLLKGTTTIGTATGYGLYTPCTGPTSVLALSYEVSPPETDFKPGDILEFRLLVWATGSQQSLLPNLHLLVNSTAHTSGITGVGLPLPGAAVPPPPAPAVFEETLEGESALVSQAFENATSATYRFNWTSNLTALSLEFNGTARNGTAQILVTDADGGVAFNATLAAEGDNGTTVADSRSFDNVTAGNWSIEIVYADFVGSVRLSLAAPPPPESAANATAAEEEPEKASDTPGPSLVGILLLVGGLAWIRRRRDGSS